MEEGKSEVQGQPSRLHSRLEVSLRYVRLFKKEVKDGELFEGFDLEALGIKRT